MSKRVFRKVGDLLKRGVMSNLSRGVDANGRKLAPKEGGGRPGVARNKRPTGGLFPLVRRGRVTSREDGVDVVFDRVVESYNDGIGSSKKPARRIVGVDRRTAAAAARLVLQDFVDEARRIGLAKRGRVR